MMLLYALGLKDPTILWYIAQVEQGQHRDGFFLNRPMGFLYTPDLSKAPVTPDLKTSQHTCTRIAYLRKVVRKFC